MKSTKRLCVLLGIITMVGIMAGCASTPSQNTKVLDDKGASFGIQTPDWVTKYVTGGLLSVEAMDEYKTSNCFVVTYSDANRDFAVAWVENASGPAEIAGVVSTTVTSTLGNAAKEKKGDAMEASIKAAATALSDASFTGARKTADWWQIVRNNKTKKEECRAFALWTIDRKSLAEQVARNLQNIVDNNKALSAAERAIYDDLISNIRRNGNINQ